MADLSIFGQRLKQLRNELGLSQREFAEKIGVTASALSAYEKGQKNPSVNVAINVALEFKVSMDWLCGLKKDSLRFKPDEIIPYDLPQALCGILNLIHSGALSIPEIGEVEGHGVMDTETLAVTNWALETFINDSYQLENLYANNSISRESFQLCLDEMVFKAAEDIRRLRKLEVEQQYRPSSSDLPF